MKLLFNKWLAMFLLVAILIPAYPGVSQAAVQSFFTSTSTTGSMTLKLYPTENVETGVSTLVTFGIPFTRGSVTPANLSKVRVLKAGVEIPAFVEMQTPWRHITNPSIDGASVRVARIQIHTAFSVSYPNYESITVEWGTTARTQNINAFEDPKTAWHQVATGSFSLADNVVEPDVYVVLPRDVLSSGVLNPLRMTPIDPSISDTRDDPWSMDATEHWNGFEEADYAFKNNFYTSINEDDPLVASGNLNPYKQSGTPSETWLYDRSSTMFDLYFRSGSFKALREAVRSTQFYKNQIYDNTTTPTKAIGLFKLKVTSPGSGAGGNSAMYSYNEPFAYDYWLTGENDVLNPIEWIVNAHEQNDEDTRWGPSLVTWTERHTAFRLLSNLIAYEVFGSSTYKNNVLSQSADFIWHQNGAGGVLPGSRIDGGLYHYGSQHGDGVSTDLVASSWMTVLVQQSMIRAYAFTEDTNIAGFIKRVGNFLNTTVKTDPYHMYDTYAGALAYPDYMMKYDGTTDSVSGYRGSAGNPHGGSTIEHNLNVGTGVLWAEYFNQLTGGTPNSAMTQLFADLYYGYDIGNNYWIRPAAPASGATAFRLTPWRKWAWEHKNGASMSWLANQLGVNLALPPEVSITNLSNGQVIAAPATVGIEASAKPGDAPLTKVEFFNGATKLGEKTSPPYSYSWSSVPAGTYSVSAKATDTNGKFTEAAKQIRVVDTTGLTNYKAATLSGQFKTYPLGNQTGTFTVEMDAVPLASSVDGGVGFSLGSAAGSWSNLAAVVRFGTVGKIEARDNQTYVGPGTPITYTANQPYHVRLVVNVPAKTYSAYVTPPASSEQTIATNIAFRSTPVAASLDTLNVIGDIGGLLVGNVTGGSGDITPPTVTMTSPSGGTVGGVIHLSANVADSGAVASVQFLVDGLPAGNPDTAAPYAVSYDASVLSNGNHLFTAEALDTAGNLAVASAVAAIVSGGGQADTVSPTVSITSPTTGSTATGTIALAANAADNVRVAGVTFYVDGKPVNQEDTTSPFEFAFNTSGLAPGSHAITAKARDTSNRMTTSAVVQVSVNDSIAPQVVVTAPQIGQTIYASSFHFGTVASDNIGVAGVKFYVDGNQVGSEDTVAPFKMTLTSGMISAGSHSLTATARDAAGNTTTSAPVSITFYPDTTSPTVAMTAPSGGAGLSGFTVLTASASDNYGLSSVQFLVDGQPVGQPITVAPYTMVYNTMGVLDGNRTFSAKATDLAGLVTTSTGVIAAVSNNSGGSGTVTFQQGVNGYNFTKDVSLSSQSSGTIAASKTAVDVNMYNQMQQASPYQMSGLLRFDQIAIPLGTKVSSAKVTLRMTPNVAGVTVEGRYLQNAWNYDSAQLTWNKRDTLLNWAVPGGRGDGTDFITGKSFQIPLTAGAQIKEVDLDPTVVQSWLDNPAQNQGLLLYVSNLTGTTTKFNSSENTTASYRPALSITFEPDASVPVTDTYRTGVNGYTGTKNITIRSSGGPSSYTGTEMSIYNKTDLTTGAYEIEGLLRFDGISLPVGKTVTSASVKLTINCAFCNNYSIQGYYLNSEWGATTATWANRITGTAWQTPGARGMGTDLISGKSFLITGFPASGAYVKTVELDPVVVQGWLDNPSSNHGLVLYTVEPGKIPKIYTSEHATESNRPELSITYQ
ncbi:Ig-like domain-containing protein [Paenibacillus qinlingensis]|uniref:DNRLRE domain-containing protein n=1 Tax=Paenibacillus qinlingensis TaxID=1837343 RepID=A0ABU1NW87_9BACL|nr:Ig-like domain-containing protein [Paenibacillus qinlingensis]MDR6551726.1 hypothetical protein [Paenibacillus qinlingensis]